MDISQNWTETAARVSSLCRPVTRPFLLHERSSNASRPMNSTVCERCGSQPNPVDLNLSNDSKKILSGEEILPISPSSKHQYILLSMHAHTHTLDTPIHNHIPFFPLLCHGRVSIRLSFVWRSNVTWNNWQQNYLVLSSAFYAQWITLDHRMQTNPEKCFWSCLETLNKKHTPLNQSFKTRACADKKMLVLPWPKKKRPLRLCIKSEHCCVTVLITQYQHDQEIGTVTRLAATSRIAAHWSEIKLDFSISHDRNSVLILCII